MAYDDRWRNDRDHDSRYGQRDEHRSYWTDRDRTVGRFGERRPTSLPYDQDESFGRGNREFGSREFGSREFGGRDPANAFDREDRYGVGTYGRDDYRNAGSGPSYGYGSDRGQGSSYTGRDYGTFGRNRDDREFGRRSVSELGFGRSGSYGRDGRDYRSDFGRDREERGFFDRAGDEVASWFGDEDAERRRRQDAQDDRHGQHRGRGPKSYQRSDERIRDDINDRLTDDYSLDASEIEVQVTGREVTLSGTVNNRQDKRRAEDVAESVSGVTHVQNNLRVENQNASWSNNQTGEAGFGSSATTGAARSTTSSDFGDTGSSTRRIGEKIT